MNPVEDRHWRRGLWWTFPLHQIISTAGVLILAGFLTYDAFSAPTAQAIMTRTPYFPVPVALAFINGFYLQRRLRHQVMQWVWVLPFLMLFFVIDQTSPSLREGLARRFGAPCPFPVDIQCVSLRVYEAVFCTSVSYSLAAFLSRTMEQREHINDREHINSEDVS